MTELNVPVTDPQTTGEMSEDEIARLLGEQTPPAPEPPAPEGGDGHTGETLAGDESVTPPAPPEPPTPPTGPSLPPELTEDAVRFQAMLKQDPSLYDAVWATINQHFAPKAAPEPEPVKLPEPPPGFDPNDPTVIYLSQIWGLQMDEYNRRLQAAEELARSHDESLRFQSEAQTQSLIDRARTSFAKDHDLSTEEATRVFDIARQTMNIAAISEAATDPVTGQTRRPGDVLGAIEIAMTAAMRSIPELHQREIDQAIAEREKNNERKAKQSALAGSGGAAPKTTELPKNTREALIQEVTRMMEGSAVQPE